MVRQICTVVVVVEKADSLGSEGVRSCEMVLFFLLLLYYNFHYYAFYNCGIN